MIFTVPTRHLAGVTLWGDYNDLRSLHETIHALTGNSPFDEGIRETLLGLYTYPQDMDSPLRGRRGRS